LRSSTVRLGLAGAAAVLLLGLVALSIGAGPLGGLPGTGGKPAATALNAPARPRTGSARMPPAIARRGIRAGPWPAVAQAATTRPRATPPRRRHATRP